MSIPHTIRQKTTFFSEPGRHIQRAFSEAEAYRTALSVSEIHRFRDGAAYPVCPRCRVTLAREYQRFCDRCGQALDWGDFLNARTIPAP